MEWMEREADDHYDAMEVEWEARYDRAKDYIDEEFFEVFHDFLSGASNDELDKVEKTIKSNKTLMHIITCAVCEWRD